MGPEGTYSLCIWCCLQNLELCKCITHSVRKINERGTQRGKERMEEGGWEGRAFVISGIHLWPLPSFHSYSLEWFNQPQTPTHRCQENFCGSFSRTPSHVSTSPTAPGVSLPSDLGQNVSWANQEAQRIEGSATMPKDLSFVLEIHTVGKDQLLRVVPWPPHVLEWLIGKTGVWMLRNP